LSGTAGAARKFVRRWQWPRIGRGEVSSIRLKRFVASGFQWICFARRAVSTDWSWKRFFFRLGRARRRVKVGLIRHKGNVFSLFFRSSWARSWFRTWLSRFVSAEEGDFFERVR
jgi:hypothetical protein